jgi:23S rRNA pseudouridine955/2504/2580 synthase
MVRLTAAPDDANLRFDRFLRRALPHVPLARIYRLIRTGDAKVNGRRARQGDRVAEGDIVDIRTSAAEVAQPDTHADARLAALRATTFFGKSFRVIFEDEALVACDKPAGLVVHPGSGHSGDDTLIALARAHLSDSSSEPLLVHRLDKDTSGVILIAKGRPAALTLSDALRSGGMRKRYVAVCHGHPPRETGNVVLALEKTFERNDGTKVRVAEVGGQHSRSSYRVLKRGQHTSLVEVELFTGRTHQIRVHMQHLQCPIVGDVRYGDESRDKALSARLKTPKRLYLHAHRLSFPHPLTGVTIDLEAPLPAAFGELMVGDGAPD